MMKGNGTLAPLSQVLFHHPFFPFATVVKFIIQTSICF